MKKFRTLLAAAGVLAAAALVATSAFAAAGKSVAFVATYSGKAVLQVTGDTAQITSVTAAGTSRVLGKSTFIGKGSGIKSDPCPLFGGPATITTRTGKLNFVITPTGGRACTDEAGQSFSLSGRATIKGGTRKYAKAKGSFKFGGTFDRGTGLFSVKFVGTLIIV